MSNSAELVVTVKNLVPKLEEKSAKGFRTCDAMRALYDLEEAVSALMIAATKEHLGEVK
jgi:hypothetical protein